MLSELRRKAPNKAVQGWFAARPASTLFPSVLTLGEIRKGVEAVADAQRRMRLNDWLEAELPAFLTGRILGINAAVADRWGRMVAAAGRPLPAIGSLLAAMAAQLGLVLVTRNVRHFARLPVQLLDPWAAAPA